MASASSIYQANLDAVSNALLSGDMMGMADGLAIPNSVLTEDSAMIVRSIDEQVIIATEFREHLLAMGMDGYVRTCIAAYFLRGRSDMIVGMHETRITKGGVLLRPTYLNRMTLIQMGNRWKGILIESDVSNEDLTILSPDLAESQRRELTRLGISLGKG